MNNNRKIQIARVAAIIITIALGFVNRALGFIFLIGYLFFGDKFVNKKFFNEGRD